MREAPVAGSLLSRRQYTPTNVPSGAVCQTHPQGAIEGVRSCLSAVMGLADNISECFLKEESGITDSHKGFCNFFL